MFARWERMAVSPSALLRLIRMCRAIDVRAVLPAIHVPTLVIQRPDDRITTPLCHGRYLAIHIAGARYFEQPGDHLLRRLAVTPTPCSPRSRTSSPGRRAAASPTACSRRSCSPRRNSTPPIASDRPRWPPDAHSAAISQPVRSHRGRLRESSAQSVLATFDAPGQAIRAAAAIRAGAAHGIQLRAGIHTGEVDLATNRGTLR